MKIAEALKQVHELQHLIDTKIPETNWVIDEIIPAPTNNQFDIFLDTYLQTGEIFETAQQLNVTDFDILLISGTKKKNIFDIKTTISSYWYKEWY